MTGPLTGPAPGLCGACRASRIVVSGRGSTFRLCERSATDARYPRYPVLPVLACPGFELADGAPAHRKGPETGPRS